MIQRIQTLFYLLAAGGFISMFYLPFAKSDQKVDGLLADQLYSVEDHLVLGGLCLFGGIMALVAIFLFKNRPLQMKLGNILIILSILIVLTAIIFFMNESATIGEQVNITEQAGIAMPVVTILLAVLANRFVKKDHKLVKSMDRLR